MVHGAMVGHAMIKAFVMVGRATDLFLMHRFVFDRLVMRGRVMDRRMRAWRLVRLLLRVCAHVRGRLRGALARRLVGLLLRVCRQARDCEPKDQWDGNEKFLGGDFEHDDKKRIPYAARSGKHRFFVPLVSFVGLHFRMPVEIAIVRSFCDCGFGAIRRKLTAT